MGDGGSEELPNDVTSILYIVQWGDRVESSGRLLYARGSKGIMRLSAALRGDFHLVASAKSHTGTAKLISFLLG